MTVENTPLRAYREGAQMTGALQALTDTGAEPLPDYARGPYGPSIAVFGHGGTYRYVLTRRWGDEPPLIWVMLNPSKAGASQDDPTIARCWRRAARLEWNGKRFGAIVVVNLFAVVTTDPKVLRYHPDPVGPGGDACLREFCRPGETVIAAWGGGPYPRLRGRAAEVTRMLTGAGVDLLCLGTTTDGQPKHPGRLAYSEPVRPWRSA